MLRKPRLHKRVTIKDVALKAGVSIGAVSRVLHGRASTIRVSEPTAEIIRQAALDLQYKANRGTYSSRSGRTKSIIVAAPFEISFASSPYYAALIDGIVSHAGEKGFTVCLSKSSMNSSMKFEDSKGKFDGIVWLGVPKDMADEDVARVAGMPQSGIHLEDSEVPEAVLNVKADETLAIINYVGQLRVKDITKIGLLAKPKDSMGLMGHLKLKDLCKRLAIDFSSYDNLEEIPGLVKKLGLEAAIVWELSDLDSLTEMLRTSDLESKNIRVSAIITDTEALGSKHAGKHFIFPLDNMCKAAVEQVILKIENPQAVTSNIALPIPLPL